jgi:hypothetical protein
VCRRRGTYHWKALDKGYNYALDLIANKGLHARLWAPKVVRIPTMGIPGIPGLPLGNSETKCHFDVAPVESYKEYYKGEDGGFPQV